MDEYIREGARKNSALLRKMQGQPEPTATAEAKPDCAPRTCSASPSDLEYCCVQILKGKFWCDAGHDLQVIFEILADKKLMDCNEHGQMVEVTPNV